MSYRYLLASFLLAGCASNSAEIPFVTQTTSTTIAPQQTMDLTHQTVINSVEYAGSREQVWGAVLRAHEALGFPAISIDPKAMTAHYQIMSRMGSIAGKPAEKYVDCGMGSLGPRTTTHRVTLTVSEAIASDSSRTRVLTKVEAIARSIGTSADAVPCASSGRLEKEIAGLIAAQMN